MFGLSGRRARFGFGGVVVLSVALFLSACIDLFGVNGDEGPIICATAPEVQLELPCSTTPLRISDDPGFIALAAGSDHTCGLTGDGRAFCWGRDLVGELGMGGWPAVATRPVPLAGDHRFVRIAAGALHTCAVTVEGQARCWGENYNGQLGTGEGPSEQPAPALVPTAVVGEIAFSDIRGGADHTCGVDTAGAAHCWGMDWYGGVGRGDDWTMSVQIEPFPVVGGHVFTAVDLGQRVTCGLDIDGRAWCWGFGDFGHLGTTQASICDDGFARIFCSPWPVPVATSRRFRTLVSGDRHACALTPNGEVFCWGDPGQGQLGPGPTGPDAGHTPAPVPNVRFDRMYAGGSTNCGVTVGGDALCWGGNWWGQLGTDSREFADATPQRVAGGHQFSVLAVGNAHTCGITGAGATYCWGSNERGQLGVGRW